MANTPGSDNPFPSVLFAEHVDPANPSAGTQRLFVDTDHLLKLRDSAGTVTTFGAAGGSGTLTTVEEVDGSPTNAGVTKLVFPNGTLGIVGTVATYTPAAGGAASLLAVKNYRPGSNANIATTSSATLADADATNLAVTFTAPASGNVLVRVTSMMDMTASNNVFWGLRESTTDLASGISWGIIGTARASGEFYLTGVSAGSHTYKWSFAAASGTHHIMGGPTWGAAIMEVWGAP